MKDTVLGFQWSPNLDDHYYATVRHQDKLYACTGIVIESGLHVFAVKSVRAQDGCYEVPRGRRCVGSRAVWTHLRSLLDDHYWQNVTRWLATLPR